MIQAIIPLQKLQGIASFVQLAEAAGICIAASEKILRRAADADYDRIVERLAQKSRGIVMFATEDETRYTASFLLTMLIPLINNSQISSFAYKLGCDCWSFKRKSIIIASQMSIVKYKTWG